MEDVRLHVLQQIFCLLALFLGVHMLLPDKNKVLASSRQHVTSLALWKLVNEQPRSETNSCSDYQSGEKILKLNI